VTSLQRRKEAGTYSSSNLRKHTNPNPIQKWLLARFHRTAAALLAQTKACNILDAGCGEGFGIYHTVAGQQKSVVGVDETASALQIARQLNPSGSFVGGDVLQLPFPSRSFDVVMCMEVLEHLLQPDQGLAELCRVSRSWLLLSVPNEPFFRGANFLRGKNVRAWGNDPGHVNHWSSQSFLRFVTRQCSVVTWSASFPWTLALCRVR
jgi:2-polyprenyl-3-methyl-5-hydroxy-6-metoxy-1,4-benzoquinol methylase